MIGPVEQLILTAASLGHPSLASSLQLSSIQKNSFWAEIQIFGGKGVYIGQLAETLNVQKTVFFPFCSCKEMLLMDTKTAMISAALMLFLTCGIASAQKARTLLFEDDFQRNESQELTDELGDGWATNSDKRAGGNKQVDLGDGTLFVFRHKDADHSVSVVHPAKYKDCRVELRLKIDHKKDDLGIDFADMDFKGVHAGHICKVFFRSDGIEMLDFKNGRMNKAYRDALKANTVTEQQRGALQRFRRQIECEITLGKWHDVVVTIIGDTMAVELDKKLIGSFSSPGMDHPEKDMIRFSASRQVRLDDLKMFELNSANTISKKAVSKGEMPINHLFVAKLLLRRLEPVGMTVEQTKAFNQLSSELRNRIDKQRSSVGITKEIIGRRDEVYSELKKSDLTGDEFWTTLQEKAGITAAQRDVFRETQEQYKKFRANALKLLTDEQRRRVPKGKLPTS